MCMLKEDGNQVLARGKPDTTHPKREYHWDKFTILAKETVA